jgi:hypothetical protein
MKYHDLNITTTCDLPQLPLVTSLSVGGSTKISILISFSI